MSLNTKYDILDNRLVIQRLNAGDRQCFEACYRFYYKGLCSFASRWVSLPVAEDIVQDTMLYIWENRDRLMEELSLKGLLFMIVRNKSLDRISSQKVHSRVHQQLEKRFADSSTPRTSTSARNSHGSTARRSRNSPSRPGASSR